MIPSKNRFHGHGSLKYTYRNGLSVRSRLMTVKTVTNPRRTNSRFSVVVSKKVFKRANGRNRMRRRIYEIVRHELPLLKPNFDTVIIITSPDVVFIEHEQLKAGVLENLRQLNLYK